MMAQFLAVRPRVRMECPSGACRSWCFRLVKHPTFDHAILVAILLNTSIMALDGYGIGAREAAILDVLNMTCTAIFVLECLAKIAAFSVCGYLKDSWHVFDFIIVLGSWSGFLFSSTMRSTFVRTRDSCHLLRAWMATLPRRCVVIASTAL